MKLSTPHNKQQGVTLVVAILFLLILTIISVFAATNSSLELKMAGNMQDSYASFQAAEAGTIATLALASNPTTDPFDGLSTDTPDATHVDCDDNGIQEATDGFDVFVSWADTATDHPLKNALGSPSAMTVCKTLTAANTVCPRTGFSADLLACDHYDIRSGQSEVQKTRTKVHLGVVKTFIGSASL